MSSTNTTILEVVLATPVRNNFDYLPPKNFTLDSDSVGKRLLVPFGNSQRIALIVKVKHSSDLDSRKLKHGLQILDDEPLLDEEILYLARWASAYYHYPLGSICFKMLPALVRKNSNVSLKQQRYWTLTEFAPTFESLNRSPKQRRVIELLSNTTSAISHQQFKSLDISSPILQSMVKKQWIKDEFRDIAPKILNPFSCDSTQTERILTTEQQLALAQCQLKGFNVHLLDGVTGSGKTEVYLQLIEKMLVQNKQVLVLVPEIGLTPQLVTRFQKRLNIPIGLLHSGLNDTERYTHWKHVSDNQYQVLIGTRSALFTPMPSLGLIIIDEEHDPSFKQQRGWAYSARDLALVRAQKSKIPIIMGSATPSLETLQNALNGKYHHLKLRKRPGMAQQATFQALDIKTLPIEHGLSRPLLQNIARHLEAGNQVIVFLNRRGYAPILMCHDCGWKATCHRCDSSFTLHQRPNHLHCHHCETSRPVPHQCPDCASNNVTAVGLGTERLESFLELKFPNYPLVRIDRDSTRKKGSLNQYLEKIQTGHYKILIGTQMLSKGHHFPDVSLVAIIDMDSALFSSDFRASEKFAQQLIQVSGRAGRANKPGQIIMQTHHPEHPQLISLIGKGYANFAKQLLVERKLCHWPPYSYLAMFRAEAKYPDLAEKFLDAVATAARNNIQAKEAISILGPVSAPLVKLAGNYRYQLLLQSNSRKSLQILLKSIIFAIDRKKITKSVRWTLDVDPLEMF